MPWKAASGIIGMQVASLWMDPDTTQRQSLGFEVDVVDEYWGGGRLIYGLSNDTILLGSVCQWDATFTFTRIPNTANLGRPVAIALSAAPAGEYAWFMRAGRWLARSGASVAADASIGITNTGVLGANSAGKQILNCRVVAAATTTVVKTANGQSGSTILYVPSGLDGWFVGIALSGTGVAASTVVTSISADNKTVVLNNALTAQINGGSITGTYNDATNFFNVLAVDNAFAQGAIT